MKTLSRILAASTAAVLLGAILPTLTAQTTWTWTGGTGEYNTTSNWDQGTKPSLTTSGNTAVIGSGAVTYTPGGDLTITNGATLRISGGSWTQAGSIAWIQLAGGNLVIDGGTFNQGTSGNIVTNASTTITISAGTANLNGNYIYQASAGTLTLSGTGTLNVANEFKPVETFAMSGGNLSAKLISFADGTGGINFSGGTITVDGSGAYSGFYGASLAKGLNFTSASVGTLFISSYTLTELSSDGLLTNGTIQIDGAANASAFSLLEANGGVYISLIGANVPEPSAFALMAGLAGLGFVSLRRRR